MQLRSFIFLGLCAAIGMSSPAFAAMPANMAAQQPVSLEKTDAIPVAAKSDAAQLKLLKKKKNPTPDDLAQIKKIEAKIVADKENAKAKALEARKLAMREAAKARADAARQAFLAQKGKSAPAAEVAEANTAKKTTKIIEPIEPVTPIQSAEPIPAEAMNVALTGNNGELRSEVVGGQKQSSGGLFAGLFGGTSSGSSISYLPETRALDSALAQRNAKKPFKVKPEFVPQDVEFTGYDA
ncbi:L,D-transpeptidase, partial [Mesorhizobium sp. M8A.F.Ca.ET.023.01.1.1]